MNEIEEKFYKSFEIKPNGYKCKDYSCIVCNEYKTCTKGKYPQITPDILLELICIWNEIIPCADDCIMPTEFKVLKDSVLEKMCSFSELNYELDINLLKHQVQSLFREGENEQL